MAQEYPARYPGYLTPRLVQLVAECMSSESTGEESVAPELISASTTGRKKAGKRKGDASKSTTSTSKIPKSMKKVLKKPGAAKAVSNMRKPTARRPMAASSASSKKPASSSSRKSHLVGKDRARKVKSK